MTTPEGQACAALQPAVAEAARAAGLARVGLVDLTGEQPGTALNLQLDRVRTAYGDGRVLGDDGAAVRLSCRLVGGRPVPAAVVPVVVARTGVPVAADLPSRLPAALDAVPADALAVVLTTWALSRLAVGRRSGALGDLREATAAAARPVAWVSVEGVGVAPSVPTLGDRPASGHSLVALARLDGGAPPVVLARCWSRGRLLAWLRGDPTSLL